MIKKLAVLGILLMSLISVATGIEPDTNIYLTPHPDHISFYNNSTYITCNFTNQETANVTIKFERYNTTDNSTDEIFDFGEFATNQTSAFNIANANFSTVGWYRVVMYDTSNDELCCYWIAVRDSTSTNFEALHGSIRFTDANSVPSVSFIEPNSGRALTWTTDSISESHSVELWEFNSSWSYGTGGTYSILDTINTSANETNWIQSYNYTLGNYYVAVLHAYDGEVLDIHIVKAVVPVANVVEITAKDVETNEDILTFTSTMIDTTKSSTDGKTIYTNVTNGEHLIVAEADNYQTGTATIYMANSYINETVYMLRYSPYTAPHYVKFKVVSVFGEVYPSIITNVTYTTASGDNASMSGITGTDGAVTFLMTPSIQYILTFTNTTQGINETLMIYPKDTEYFMYIDSFSWSPPENQTTRDTVDWWWTHGRINVTYGWINFTYTDAANETASVNYWINSSNDTNIYSFNTTYPDSWTVSQIVPANNTTYIVHFSADHPRFDSLSGSMRSTISFGGLKVSFGWSEQWMYDTVAVCAIIFIGLMFSATSVNVGAVISALSGWMFMWMGWLSGTTVNYGMMVLATIVAVGFAMRKGEVMHT